MTQGLMNSIYGISGNKVTEAHYHAGYDNISQFGLEAEYFNG